MISTSLLLLLMAQGPGATAQLKQGEKLFATSCAVGYCHGQGGSANRGPRLAGRGVTRDYLERVVRKGIPNTAMPAFESRLKASDLDAVIEYTAKLSAAKAAETPPAPSAEASVKLPPPVPAEFKRGRDLFFDPNRIVRCATCHQAQGEGIKVAEMRKGQVQQATVADATKFPALVQSDAAGVVKVFDLTVPPPVLRTAAKSDVKLGPMSNWDHAAVSGKYSAMELKAIRAYIDWASKR